MTVVDGCGCRVFNVECLETAPTATEDRTECSRMRFAGGGGSRPFINMNNGGVDWP